MRALSLWQPWASAVAVGSKRNETRSWRTSYRGPIAIHAAKRFRVDELLHLLTCWNWCGALRPAGIRMGDDRRLEDRLPFGAVVALGELVDCRPTDEMTQTELDAVREPVGEASPLYRWTERQMGDYSLGRFSWVFRNVHPLATPVPVRGHQGLWNLTPAEVDAIGAEIRRAA